jgi:5-methylcytosine-specific restriction endonuclease McrA
MAASLGDAKHDQRDSPRAMLLGPGNRVSHPWIDPYVGRRCSQKWDNVSFRNHPPQEDVTNQMSRKSAYQVHLASPYWKAVRNLVKERDGHRCVLCNTPEDLTVHHRTYKHVGREMDNLGDLTTLCRPCHEAHHATKDAMRKARRKPRKTLAPLYLSDSLDK